MIDFVWRVPTAGYRWYRRDGEDLVEVADDAPPDPTVREFLVPVDDGKFRDALPDDAPAEDWLIYRDTRPLREHTGLFRAFAATKRTRAGVRGFAASYGNLGAEEDALGELEDRADSVEPPAAVETAEDYAEWLRTTQWEYRRVDSLARWQDEIERMRRCAAAWNAARTNGSDPKRAAGVLQTINNALWEHGVGCALAPAAKPARGPRERVALQVVPVSLAGAVWAQFAQAVAGDYDHRQCAECGAWFAVNPEASRTSRLYCGEACRARHYRTKKASARRLHGEGRPLKAITEELQTDITTLKGWLKPKGT